MQRSLADPVIDLLKRRSFRRPLARIRISFLTGLIVACPLPSPAASAPIVALKRLSLEELMDVQVTSVSRFPERLGDTASAIQVITAEDIRRSGAISLPEVLRLANNLNVARKNSHDWGISARGFNTELANKLLVMIDGRTLYTPLFSGVRWDVQDYLLEDVERVEAISGPGGTLWGANAVNGVINIVTKPAADTQGLYLEAATGDSLDHFLAGRLGGQLTSKVHYRVYAKRQSRDGEILARGPDSNDSWHLTQAGFRIDAAAFAQDTLTIQGDAYWGHEGFVAGDEASVRGSNLLGRWTHTFSSMSDFQLQLYYDHAYLRQPVRSQFAPPGFFTDRLDTYDLDFQHRVAVHDRHRFVWGLGYRQTIDKGVPTTGLAFVPANLRQHLASAFAQLEVSLAPALTLTAGTKIEDTDYTGTEVEPNARFQWKLNRDSSIWSAVSRAVRTPSRIDRDLRQPAVAPVVLSGGRDFASETVVAYELGYRAQLASRLALSVAGFYNDYAHIRSLAQTPLTFLPLFFANDLEGETYGAELTTNIQLAARCQVFAGYTLLKSDIRVRPGGSDFNNALNENSDPEHQFSLRTSIDLGRGVELDTNLRWVDTLRNNNSGRVGAVPGYQELDVRLAWQASRQVELSLTGKNLLDTAHPEFGVPSPNRVEIKREFLAKATWRF